MITAPRVTVLIDTYNYGHFIEQAIDSVLSQDFPTEQMEVLVVDDGSTDDTAQRVAKYGDRLRYLRKPNGGQASAFNFGLAHALGALIFFLDADDYWLPGKLSSLVPLFEQRTDLGMVYHRLEQFDQSAGSRSHLYFVHFSGFLPEDRHALLSYLIPPTSSLAFRRTVLDQLLPVPETLNTQADAYLAALAVFLAPISSVPETLGVYRLHGRNLFSCSAASPPDAAARRRRMTTRQAFLDHITRWLTLHGRDVCKPPLRSYLNQWNIMQQEDGFQLAPPGRFRYFRHLCAASIQFAPRRTWRHNLVALADAIGALFTGYRSPSDGRRGGACLS